MFFVQADSVTSPATSPVQWVVGYVFSNVIPLITAWVVSKYNLAQGSFAHLSNAMKMTVYVLATVVLMYLCQWLALGAPSDVSNLGPDFIGKLIEAGVATLLVKLGIGTGRAKPVPGADNVVRPVI